MLGNFHIPNGPALLRAADGDLAAMTAAIKEIRRKQWFPSTIEPDDIRKALKKLERENQADAA
jgi:hypothetical protein